MKSAKKKSKRPREERGMVSDDEGGTATATTSDPTRQGEAVGEGGGDGVDVGDRRRRAAYSDDRQHREDDADDSHEHSDREQQQQRKKHDRQRKRQEEVEEKDDDDPSSSSSHPPTSVISEASFESLGVIPQLCGAAESMRWTSATQIQKEAIPPALEGRDVIGLAETGSGKTGAFAIPILQSLLKNPSKLFAVVLAPTRELAFQIHDVFQALGSSSIGATSVCVVGGVDMTSQAIALARQPHIITATPGRLVDHLEHTKGFHLKNLRYLIMDEADRMLSMDFEEELNKILSVVPDSAAGRRTMLFSATMTSKVQKLQRASLCDPVRVEVSTKFQTPKQLLQHYLFIPAKYKDCYLTYLVNEFAGQTVLVFGATCNNVQRLALMLRNLNFRAVCLHGQMSQPKRLGALHKFKSGARDVLICTDVASRGLDIPNVDVVINYDLPGHGKDYVHRVGRTARAGRSGRAVAMVTQYDVEVYQRLERLLGRRLPKYECDEETVLVLLERVSEAQRMATRELKEQLAAAKGGGKHRHRRRKGMLNEDGEGGAAGEEGGVEGIVREELRKKGFYAGGEGGHQQRGRRGDRKRRRHRA